MGNSLFSMMDTSLFSLLLMILCFYCLFSYPSLLELHYGGRIKRSQITREWARETGLSVREVEQRIDTKPFLSEYPRWELGAPHWSIILHEMFLHAAGQGQKEAESLICQGCQGSASEPDLEVGQSAMELVRYQTSHKEIWDIYHSVYLLRWCPGLLPCGAQWTGKAIINTLSSLTSQLHRQGEGLEPKDEWLPMPSRRDSYKETIKVAHQRALEMVEVLRSDIERLSQGMRDVPRTHSRSQSRSRRHNRSQSRSHSWSQGRGHSQSDPQSCPWSRQPRSPSASPSWKRVMFQEPEIKSDSKREEEGYPPEPSIFDVETWLDWQSSQLSTRYVGGGNSKPFPE